MAEVREPALMLDVVMITRNQAWNVRRLIESVLAQTTQVPLGDVILVDSASTDDTVQIAMEYPIRVIRLSKKQRLTAAAGRHVGMSQARSDVVLFLDGDMELRPGWAPEAMSLLEREPRIAAVSGEVIDQSMHSITRIRHCAPRHIHTVPYTDVPHGGGAAAYRREVLAALGSFNPFLFSDEEPELCLRLREAGYRIVRLQLPISDHYSDPPSAIATLFARRKRNLYLGPGQALRLHLRSSLLLPYVKERGFGLIPVVGLALGAGCAVASAILRDPRMALAWLAGACALFAGDAVRRRSAHRALFGFVQRLLFAEGTMRGFLMRPAKPSDFTFMIEVIK